MSAMDDIDTIIICKKIPIISSKMPNGGESTNRARSPVKVRMTDIGRTPIPSDIRRFLANSATIVTQTTITVKHQLTINITRMKLLETLVLFSVRYAYREVTVVPLKSVVDAASVTEGTKLLL